MVHKQFTGKRNQIREANKIQTVAIAIEYKGLERP
jgi:hypothetical protein